MSASEDSQEGGQDKDPKKRRPRGDGGLWWSEKRQRWIAEITVGYTPAGKRITRSAIDRSKTKALKKLHQKLRDRDDGLPSEDAKYTVQQAVENWLEHGQSGLDEDTVIKNWSLARNHIIPLLGARKLTKLTADEVDKWFADRAEVLSTDTLRQLHSILRRAITRAQKRDKVKRNIVLLCEVPPGQEGRPSKALTIEQAIAVVEASVRTAMYAYITVSMLTGARTEEVRALLWSHVVAYVAERDAWVPVKEAGWDHEKFAIYIWRSDRAGGRTKTKKSRRSLLLPRRCVEALQFHMELQDEQRRAAGDAWEEYGLVFASAVGTLRNANNVIRSFRAILAKTDLVPEEWTPRELRHSFVSILSANRVPIEDISRLAGHTSTSVTETVYWRQISPALTFGAEAMDELFKPQDDDP